MKKVSLLAAVLSTAAINWAAADSTIPAGCPKAFQGLYAGANIGVGVGTGRTQAALFDNTVTPREGLFGARSTVGARGVDGGIGVGYLRRFGQWGAGIAFDANWTGVKGKHSFLQGNGNPDFQNPDAIRSHVKLENSLQLYGRLGYVIREVAMPFVKLGWANSKWKANTRVRYVNDFGTVITASANKSKRTNGFMFGGGVDVLAWQHVVVGLEYTGIWHNNTKRASRVLTVNTPNDIVFAGNLKSLYYQKVALTLKIVY